MKMPKSFKSAVLNLFFPEVCMACSGILLHQESTICTKCLFHLPYTDDHLIPNNESFILMQGKLRVERAISMLRFRPSSRVEHLIHQMKYANKPQLGKFLGHVYGTLLKEIQYFDDVDAIIPIPLHPRRFAKRGYNQSEYFGMGIAERLGKPMMRDVLYRAIHNATQTKKDLVSRAEGVDKIFCCSNELDLHDKHILLLDDVLTTGSTLASAGNTLLDKFPGCRISIATIAKA